MVSDILQYLPEPPALQKAEAEALLSGIMLDTKTFILRTGVRTFEAAAYLRRQGADPVEVSRLFASSMKSYKEKSNIVASAEIH
jgi:c-di-AMP phosphodiesterase-like protein